MKVSFFVVEEIKARMHSKTKSLLLVLTLCVPDPQSLLCDPGEASGK